MTERTGYKEDIERPVAVFETNLGDFETEAGFSSPLTLLPI
jgi:hypothetical protein